MSLPKQGIDDRGKIEGRGVALWNWQGWLVAHLVREGGGLEEVANSLGELDQGDVGNKGTKIRGNEEKGHIYPWRVSPFFRSPFPHICSLLSWA